MSARQLQAAGKAARRLLGFAWEQVQRDSWLVTWALRLVCRTFQSDPSSSGLLLRRAFEPEHMARYAFEEMHWIAREIGPLIILDPGLVEDLYKAAFSFKETSDARTIMGGGKIFALSSNRRQDFQGALYELAGVYPRFLREAPLHGTRALISALEAYVAMEHPPSGSDVEEQVFDFEGTQATIRVDYSSIWDSGSHITHDALTVLNEFESYIRGLSETTGDARTRKQVLEVLVSHNRSAAIWRRLLLVGAEFPHTLGSEIRCLAWVNPILTSFDTSVAAGKFLGAVFGSLSESERERTEREILSIPTSAQEERREYADTVVDRLLGCLPPESVVTEEARRRLAVISQEGGPPRNEPLVRIGPTYVTPYSETEYLAGLGVPLEAECNRRVEELCTPVRQFASSHLNSTPTTDEAEAMLSPLQELHDKLRTAGNDGVHIELANQAWGHLAEACERIARVETLSCDHGVGALAKDILLEAAKHSIPLPNPESNAQFDEFPSWGGPSARISVAAGLPLMARRPECVDDALLGEIEQLSVDRVPAVRLQIATRLRFLYYTAPDIMWRILEHMTHEDESRGVLAGLVGQSCGPLAGPHGQRVAGLVENVFNRVVTGPGAKGVRQVCVNVFSGLYLWQDNPKCKEILFQIGDNPETLFEDISQLLVSLREAMTTGPVERPSPKEDQVLKRAIALMLHVLKSTRAKVSELENSLREISTAHIPAEMRERAEHLGRLADSACHEIYFASGAFDHRSGGGGAPSPHRIGTPEKRRFLSEVKPALSILGSFGFPPVVHNLLETLEFLLDVDPREVFFLIAEVVRSGKAGGYQYEQMAADLIVRLIGRYLAEYRHILREDRECREALREILDTFVQWPNARRLTYRLDEIFK
jgi:hypothetical protein